MSLNCILMLFLGWKVFFHPFYVSLTEIRHNASSEAIEVSQRIFWDDLEVALERIHGEKVDFLNSLDKEALNRMVGEYLLERNRIVVDGTPLVLNYLGFEIEDDAAWFYMEAVGVTSQPQKVEIYNSVLVQHFDGQQNIVNFYVGKKPKSLLLTKGKERGSLVLY